MNNLIRTICAAGLIASSIAPCLAQDYESKQVMWCLKAPVKLVGALSGAAVSGLISGPIDGGYHGAIKGTTHVAGKFGDEKGTGQLLAAAPLGGSVGLVLGGTYGIYDGISHGLKTGWKKPFSRWSYITMEEK